MSRRVRVHHPGYQGTNTLFIVPARDGPNHDAAYYTMIHDACCILTGERDTFLTSTAQGDSRVVPDQDGLIQAGEYYVHVGEESVVDFPVAATFRLWAFPHSNIPAHWLQAAEDEKRWAHQESFNASSVSILETCRITRRHLARNIAHIIPTSEQQWFATNDMQQYGSLATRPGEIGGDSVVNKMCLKVDAHQLWDSYHYSIVAREVKDGEFAWFTQMMIQDDELEKDWHSIRLQPLVGRAPEYLYARFAYDIFPKLIGFLTAGQPRRLTIHATNGARETRIYSATECAEFAQGQGKGRSVSPTKRPRGHKDSPNDSEEWDEDDTQTNSRSISPPTSIDSDAECIVRRDKRRSSGVIPDRPSDDSKTPSFREQYGEAWWAYVCGHDYGEERGRKRRRN